MYAGCSEIFMRIVKRLYLFVLKSFLPLFAMTFFIVLFIVLMQFLWKYIDDLVGKGLSPAVLGELFFYAGVSMVPMALPLAILLASLMTFGNLGEKSELTAVKAAGVSLLKLMQPLIILVMLVAVGAFFFQNDVLPRAQVKMWTLLFSMKQKSPEVEIPEGVFYDQIPGYNLFVKTKNRDTGMLYDVMIYDLSKGGSNSTILLADSARLAFTGDSRYLYLHLFTGEQFENLREQRSLDRNVPFRRESFLDKEILIPFDANFNRLDEGGMRKQYVGKNITELRETIDSVSARVDSVGDVYAKELRRTAFPVLMPYRPQEESPDFGPDPTSKQIGDESADVIPLNVDSMINLLTPVEQGDLIKSARRVNESRREENQFRVGMIKDEKKTIRRHEIELIKKFTLSVACIIFFFIGAPLGAIIRKGGIGTPLVISVLLFLVYYIIDNTGYKMARDGRVEVWIGMWLSTSILLPLGIYVTLKAMNDSSVFNKDAYISLFRRIFGLKESRHVVSKEVIISEVDNPKGRGMLAVDYALASSWLMHHKHCPGYFQYWKKGLDMPEIEITREYVEKSVEYLSDSRNIHIIDKLNSYPVIRNLRIYHPAGNETINKILCYIFPLGGIIYLFARLHYRILAEEMHKVTATSEQLMSMLKDE